MVVKKKKKTASKKKSVKRKAIRKRITKKKITKKGRKKAAVKKASAIKKEKENIIGTVTHYFPKVNAGVIKLKAPLAIGDTIRIKGHTTDFTQEITSLQIDRVPIQQAKKGEEIGLLVNSRVRKHDIVSKV